MRQPSPALADIERQLLAPLEALLRDAQAVLGDRTRCRSGWKRRPTEDRLNRQRFDFPAAEPDGAGATEPSRDHLLRVAPAPPVARRCRFRYSRGAPAVEQGEFPQSAGRCARSRAACRHGALPTALQGTRFEQCFSVRFLDPAITSQPQVGTDRSAGPASTRPHFNRPAPIAESFPVSGQHDASEFPAVEWPIQPGEHPETRAARMLSGDGRQTPDARDRSDPTTPLRSHRLQPISARLPDSRRAYRYAISLRRQKLRKNLGESRASCRLPTTLPRLLRTRTRLRPDQHPQVPTAAMPSGDGHQPLQTPQSLHPSHPWQTVRSPSTGAGFTPVAGNSSPPPARPCSPRTIVQRPPRRRSPARAGQPLEQTAARRLAACCRAVTRTGLPP
jgi:hypothetical protein